MIKNFTAQKILMCALMSVVVFATSCKKSSNAPATETASNETNVLQTSTTNRDFLTKDSIFLYAKQTYLWNVGMPSYDNFNPRQYSSNDAVLAALRALPSSGGKDKYSFIDDGTVAGQLGGVSGDFGFSVFFNPGSNTDLRIKYVYATSPAATQGLKRGYQITKINGNSNISTSATNITFIQEAIFGSNPTVALTVLKPDGSTQDVVVTRATYNINPILATNTFTVGTKKVGYINFNSFTTNSVSLLDAAFAKFATDGITELVVDLRYNGGGSVATSEAFTNLIAPSSQNGKVMYTTYWTQTMQDGKATILQNQKFYAKGTDGVTRLYSMFDYSWLPTAAAGNQEVFVKRGSVNNLTRVYFLVTVSTASASELLINNLKPVMDVKLIGSKTYGKPVGFFAIKINKSDLYIPQFQTKNQLNQGDYFDGMAVDKSLVDDVSKDFGDTSEKLLAQALNYSATGSFTSISKDNTISSTSAMGNAELIDVNAKLDHGFKGMIETRKLKF
ncbi:S41 family peptidase [Pedobacter aquatilis]|uniref:S41 family peptidase n=1 Tax=Pedobacter aquatilis TaxID=351343 RepID=UPI00292CFEFF|nr:S41 family peptidase [Pedobacter aquatilis]